MTGNDIIVVGASAGGLQALSKLVVQFPADLRATVFIVQQSRPLRRVLWRRFSIVPGRFPPP